MTRKGFTLVELIVVIVVIGVLIALLLPSVRYAREPARRMSCANNAKQIVLGLQNYHETFLFFPYGARARTNGLEDDDATPTCGPSWLVATLPFCEQRPLFDKIVAADQLGSGYDGGSATAGVRGVAHNAKIKYMLCPSSSLPETETVGGLILTLPSYAGIMGASDHKSSDATRTVDPKRRFAFAPYGGVGAGNGMLLINESLEYMACSDGSANQIIVGEVSEWYYNDAAQKFNPAPASEAGWLAGTSLQERIAGDGFTIPADRVFNLVTIEHAVGLNNRQGKSDEHPSWNTKGIGRCGLNNPLLSGHPAGATVGYLDGHVQLLTKQTAPFIIKRLAIRDDGGEIPEF